MYNVLLYYKFTPVPDPDQSVAEHKELCALLDVKGRILINAQGINGTLAGTPENVEKYKQAMDAHAVWNNIDFKESTSEDMPFPRMRIRHRKEIITTGVPESCDLAKRGQHVDRDTFQQWLESGEDMVIVDMRNDYEYAVGRFKGAIRPPMKYFRDLDQCWEFYEQFKGKKVVMYCTGGIRCEPASSLFLNAGFDRDNVYQLEGGIVKYAEKYADTGFYEGACFVFDERMIVPVNTSESREIVGECALCLSKTETFRNCANKACNRLFLGCDDCAYAYINTCSDACKDIVQNDASAMRPPRVNDIRVAVS